MWVALLGLAGCATPAVAKEPSAAELPPNARTLPNTSDTARVLADFKLVDVSSLPGPARVELAAVLTDEFDYCGRPLTLAAVLKKGDACPHTRRLLTLAATLAKDGASATEILNLLSREHQSFSTKRQEFKPDPRMCLGPADAKVTLVEFSDFECPYCGAARPILEAFQKSRSDVRFCSQLVPLSAHPNSIPAAQAALFARDKGKFWAVHDSLFENQTALSEAAIKNLAQKAGLEGEKVAKLFGTDAYKDEIAAFRELGRQVGVESTPTLFVNGRKMPLNITPEILNLTVNDELDWQRGKGTWPRE